MPGLSFAQVLLQSREDQFIFQIFHHFSGNCNVTLLRYCLATNRFGQFCSGFPLVIDNMDNNGMDHLGDTRFFPTTLLTATRCNTHCENAHMVQSIIVRHIEQLKMCSSVIHLYVLFFQPHAFLSGGQHKYK